MIFLISGGKHAAGEAYLQHSTRPSSWIWREVRGKEGKGKEEEMDGKGKGDAKVAPQNGRPGYATALIQCYHAAIEATSSASK